MSARLRGRPEGRGRPGCTALGPARARNARNARSAGGRGPARLALTLSGDGEGGGDPHPARPPTGSPAAVPQPEPPPLPAGLPRRQPPAAAQPAGNPRPAHRRRDCKPHKAVWAGASEDP